MIGIASLLGLALVAVQPEAEPDGYETLRAALPEAQGRQVDALMSGETDPFEADLGAWRFDDGADRQAYEALERGVQARMQAWYQTYRSDYGLAPDQQTAGCPPLALGRLNGALQLARHGETVEEHQAAAERVAAVLETMASALENIEAVEVGSTGSWARFRDGAVQTDDDRVRELLLRTARDQYLRQQISLAVMEGSPAGPLAASIAAVLVCNSDVDNTAWLGDQIAAHGWFTLSEHGALASQGAWLIAQHSDANPAFQRDVLELIEPLAREGEVSPQNYAFLYDRVATGADEPQRFATQGRCTDGRWEPWDLEDPDNIDAIRAEYGLGTLAERLEQMAGRCPPSGG